MPRDSDGDEPGEPLRLVHHHPGRLRMRAGVFLVRDGGVRPELERALAVLQVMPGVTRIAHSPFTGSLLVEYQPGRVEPGALLAAVSDAAGLDGVTDAEAARSHDSEVTMGLVRAVHQANRVARSLTGGRADLRTLMPGALFVGAIFSLLRRPELPRWDNLLYWSYNVFRDLNRHTIEAVALDDEEEDVQT